MENTPVKLILKTADVPYPEDSTSIKFEATITKLMSSGDAEKDEADRKRPMKFQVMLENKEKLIIACWKYTLLDTIKEGQTSKDIYLFEGKSGYFGREETSIRIDKITNTQKTSIAKTVPFSEDVKVVRNAIENLIHTYVENKSYKKLLHALLSDNFYTWPAAKSIHHDFPSGLAVHSYQVAVNALNMYDSYSDNMELNRELIVVGALLHDIGKIEQYTIKGEFTTNGNLLGHIGLGINAIVKACQENKIDIHSKDIIKLLHIIESHHGELEYGSPVKPITPEAYIVSFADQVDSKLTAIAEVYNNMVEDECHDVNGIGGKIMKV